jgi:ADP-ribose pyrophosphatase YjhB (NUDIX family)
MLSPYITNIRRKIGNDFLMLPSATILVRNSENKLLLVRHHNKGLWVTPGGMIEPDETPAQAAIREMKEETGCDVELIRLIGVYGGRLFHMDYENGDLVGYTAAAFEARIINGEPTPDGKEILETSYFSYDEIKSLPSEKWLHLLVEDLYLNRVSLL